MAQITQFISRTLPEATGLPRPPAGGFWQPVAEGMAGLSDAVLKYTKVKQAISDEAELASKEAEAHRGLADLDESLKGITDPEEYKKQSYAGLNTLTNQLISTSKSGLVKRELSNRLKPEFAKLFITKYKKYADDVLFRDKIVTQIGDANREDINIAVYGDNKEVRYEARNRVFGRLYDLEQRGFITPAEKQKQQIDFLRLSDREQARQAMEADPAVDNDTLLKNFKNLFPKDIETLIDEADRTRLKKLELQSKQTKEAVLTDVRMRAMNGELNTYKVNDFAIKYQFTHEELNAIQGEVEKNFNEAKARIKEYIIPISGFEAMFAKLDDEAKRKRLDIVYKAWEELDERVNKLGQNPNAIYFEIAKKYSSETPSMMPSEQTFPLSNMTPEQLADGFQKGTITLDIFSAEIERRNKEAVVSPEKIQKPTTKPPIRLNEPAITKEQTEPQIPKDLQDIIESQIIKDTMTKSFSQELYKGGQ